MANWGLDASSQRHAAGLHVLVWTERAAAHVDALGAGARVQDCYVPRLGGVDRPDRGQVSGGGGDAQGVADGLGPTGGGVDRLGELDRLVGVEQARTLLGGRRAQVARGAHQDLLDQGRGRGGAAVGLSVGLDHQRSRTGHERRGLAGAAALLDVGRMARGS